jgi:hypothetical protein
VGAVIGFEKFGVRSPAGMPLVLKISGLLH